MISKEDFESQGWIPFNQSPARIYSYIRKDKKNKVTISTMDDEYFRISEPAFINGFWREDTLFQDNIKDLKELKKLLKKLLI